MGYRASIKNINSIGHLINGNICTFFEETISSSEMFHSNMLLLENLIFRTRDRLFMSEEYWDLLHSDLIYTKERWSHIRNHLEYIYDLHHRNVCGFIQRNEKHSALSFYKENIYFLDSIT